MDYPLSGLKVLDFSRVLAGPFAGRMLSDLVLMWLKLSHQREMSLASGVKVSRTSRDITINKTPASGISALTYESQQRLLSSKRLSKKRIS